MVEGPNLSKQFYDYYSSADVDPFITLFKVTCSLEDF